MLYDSSEVGTGCSLNLVFFQEFSIFCDLSASLGLLLVVQKKWSANDSESTLRSLLHLHPELKTEKGEKDGTAKKDSSLRRIVCSSLFYPFLILLRSHPFPILCRFSALYQHYTRKAILQLLSQIFDVVTTFFCHNLCFFF